MNREKLEKAQQELKCVMSSAIIYLLPYLEKPAENDSFKITNPQSAKEWLTITNYHPLRGIVVSVSIELQHVIKPNDVIYIDVARTKNLTQVLHNGEVYHKIYYGDIIGIVTGAGAEVNFEEKKANRIIN